MNSHHNAYEIHSLSFHPAHLIWHRSRLVDHIYFDFPAIFYGTANQRPPGFSAEGEPPN